jgi:biotin carboxylase
MNAIILLDPVTEWNQILKAAKERNLVTIAIQLSPVPGHMRKFIPTEEALREAGVDHVLDLQDRDCFNCVNVLQLLKIDENLRIQAAIPLSETAVDYVDVIAAMLGLEHHNLLHQITSRRDKGYMKEAVLRSGVRVAAFARICDPCEIQNFLDEHFLDWPVVIKTPQGFSTTDVYICESLLEARRAVDSIVGSLGPEGRRVRHALVEEYVDGTEFAVNLMAFEGKLTVTDVWRYVKTDKARYTQAEICDPNDETLQHVVEYCVRVGHAVGIRFGAGHVEVKAELDFDGTFVDPCMIEVGSRLSGGRKATMTQAALKGAWDPFSAMIDAHSGVQPKFPSSFTPKLFVQHLFLPVDRTGYVEDVHLDETDLTTLHSLAMIVKKGDFVKETTDITSCAGFLWFVGEKADVEHDAERALSSFKLTVTDKAD